MIYNKNSIDTLSDIFQAWSASFKPQKPNGDFFRESGLSELISESDLQKLIDGKACFSKETQQAIYGLLPIKLKLKNIELNIFPQIFNRLNHQAMQQENTGIINISLKHAQKIYQQYYLPKIASMKQNENRLRYENRKAKDPEQFKISRRKYLNSLSPEQNALRLEKERERMRKRYIEHPELAIRDKERKRKKIANFTPIERLEYLIHKRILSKKYREENKEKIAERNRYYRLKRKQEKTESKQFIKDKKQYRKNYYDKHKEEIKDNVKNNPNRKIIEKKYLAKKRFKQKTGQIILSLLEAIKNAKSK